MVEAEGCHRAGLEVLAEDVGARREADGDFATARILEIDREAQLVAVEHREEAGAGTEQASGVVAFDRLDLDHLGTQVAKDQAAGRPHHHVAEFDHSHAGKRQVPGARFGRTRAGTHASAHARSPDQPTSPHTTRKPSLVRSATETVTHRCAPCSVR